MIQQINGNTKQIDLFSGVILPAGLAIVFGVFLVFGTGFAHSDILHNAAHDTRHAFTFPCH